MIRLGDRHAAGKGADRGPDDRPFAPVEHGSPGLAAVIAALGADPGSRVLDFGPAVPANIGFYGAFASHVRVVDAVLELASHVGTDDEEGDSFGALLDEIWAGFVGVFDVVLAWDLISHISRESARSVISRLHAVCRPGSRLFLMTYAGATMPSLPQVFEIRSADRLLYRPCSADVAAVADLPPAEVERLLRGFRVESSFLLRHGVREYAAIRV